VPLTSSLYVSGKLKNAGKVLVDIGTGYYIEKVWLNTNIADMTDQQRRYQILY
jgi:prefoldin alpha subunit